MAITQTIVLADVVDEMPDSEYHQHPALSSSQARTLLASPARYRYERDHPRQPTREMQLGTCVHTQVFGTGQRWAVLPEGDGRTKAVKDAKAEIEARGEIALTSVEARLVKGMAAAVMCHPEAGQLLAGDGVAERSLFWADPETGAPCRARPDWLLLNGRAIVDLKTTGDASPAALPRHIERYGYHIQQGWYEDGARHLGLVADDSVWRWVFVEREPPHLVCVATLDPADVRVGHELAAFARQKYRDCVAADLWPGYPEHTITVSLPPWSRRSHDIEESTW